MVDGNAKSQFFFPLNYSLKKFREFGGKKILKIQSKLTDCLCKNLEMCKPQNFRICFNHFHGSIYFILKHHEQYKHC